VAIGLLCAGVAGNLTDRLFRPPGVLRGHVIDFLELPHWPIFNVADMCITAAAIMIMFLSIVKGISITGQPHPRPGRGDSGGDGDHDRSTIARG
jgi:signal peptidase II